MTTRRAFLATFPAAFSTALPALAALAPAPASAAASQCAVFTSARQKSTSPEEALRLLAEGNARFVAGKTINCDLRAQVRETAGGQAPFAAILGCIDSRVPPELVFDQRLGDIFCARIAGNFVNTDILGSLEFATKLEGAKLIVVLGHRECGAVKGAVDGAKLGNLTAMLERLAPAVAAAHGIAGPHSSKNGKLVQAVADANVAIAVRQLTERSEVLRALVAAKELAIVPAMNDIATGRVTFTA